MVSSSMSLSTESATPGGFVATSKGSQPVKLVASFEISLGLRTWVKGGITVEDGTWSENSVTVASGTETLYPALPVSSGLTSGPNSPDLIFLSGADALLLPTPLREREWDCVDGDC